MSAHVWKAYGNVGVHVAGDVLMADHLLKLEDGLFHFELELGLPYEFPFALVAMDGPGSSVTVGEGFQESFARLKASEFGQTSRFIVEYDFGPNHTVYQAKPTYNWSIHNPINEVYTGTPDWIAFYSKLNPINQTARVAYLFNSPYMISLLKALGVMQKPCAVNSATFELVDSIKGLPIPECAAISLDRQASINGSFSFVQSMLFWMCLVSGELPNPFGILLGEPSNWSNYHMYYDFCSVRKPRGVQQMYAYPPGKLVEPDESVKKFHELMVREESFKNSIIMLTTLYELERPMYLNVTNVILPIMLEALLTIAILEKGYVPPGRDGLGPKLKFFKSRVKEKQAFDVFEIVMKRMRNEVAHKLRYNLQGWEAQIVHDFMLDRVKDLIKGLVGLPFDVRYQCTATEEEICQACQRT